MPDEARRSLADALAQADDASRRRAISAVAATWPTFCEAWAELGAATPDPVEAYAYYRVGYHRGLDQLRGAGWRGSGYVRAIHPENRGFLASLRGLGRAAERIGETGEAERCAEFARQLDP